MERKSGEIEKDDEGRWIMELDNRSGKGHDS